MGLGRIYNYKITNYLSQLTKKLSKFYWSIQMNYEMLINK